MADKKVNRKKKVKLSYTKGVAHIHCSSNNTIISISDEQGKVIAWASSGTVGFKNSKKSTPYAAQVAAESCAKQCYDRGLRSVSVMIKGPGQGRDYAIRALAKAGLKIDSLNDVTPVPHNGCRPQKRPRK